MSEINAKKMEELLRSYDYLPGEVVTIKPKKAKPGAGETNALCSSMSFMVNYPVKAVIEQVYPRFYVLRSVVGKYSRTISKQDLYCGDFKFVRKGEE